MEFSLVLVRFEVLTAVLTPAFTLVSCKAFSTLKMEAIYSSEISVDSRRNTQRYIPEDSKYTISSKCVLNVADTNFTKLNKKGKVVVMVN
jgi:hypothetical protein